MTDERPEPPARSALPSGGVGNSPDDNGSRDPTGPSEADAIAAIRKRHEYRKQLIARLSANGFQWSHQDTADIDTLLALLSAAQAERDHERERVAVLQPFLADLEMLSKGYAERIDALELLVEDYAGTLTRDQLEALIAKRAADGADERRA